MTQQDSNAFDQEVFTQWLETTRRYLFADMENLPVNGAKPKDVKPSLGIRSRRKPRKKGRRKSALMRVQFAKGLGIGTIESLPLYWSVSSVTPDWAPLKNL